LLYRSIFIDEHELLRVTARRFLDKEVIPFHADWEQQGMVPREAWRKAGDAGILCCDTPETYGGPGGSFLHAAVVIEEIARSGATGAQGFMLHSDYFAPYLIENGSETQKQQWLPPMVRGEIITAIAMTEPDAGSDLANIRTSASPDGEHWRLNGQKTYISNGQQADLLIVAAKTDLKERSKGISLFLVEASTPGFTRGRRLEKIGLKAQDTSELFFEDVRVPRANLLGPLHGGFKLLMQKLARERLCQAIRSCAAVETMLEWTINYVRERRAFGSTIADFQNTQFVLAEIHTKALAARAFVDYCIGAYIEGRLDSVVAAAAKLHLTDLHCEAADRCLQLFGGAGYLLEYPIARAYADARVTRITGGTSEIMKQIIGRKILA
jgi:acyl-CoA dehydrogenase